MLLTILEALAAVRERSAGRLGNVKSSHCNTNLPLTLMVLPRQPLALSRVTSTGLSTYGEGGQGETGHMMSESRGVGDVSGDSSSGSSRANGRIKIKYLDGWHGQDT